MTEKVLTTIMNEIKNKDVLLEGLIIKTNMVTPGQSCETKYTAEDIAWSTYMTLKRSVSPSVAGIFFLSGDQT